MVCACTCTVADIILTDCYGDNSITKLEHENMKTVCLSQVQPSCNRGRNQLRQRRQGRQGREGQGREGQGREGKGRGRKTTSLV